MADAPLPYAGNAYGGGASYYSIRGLVASTAANAERRAHRVVGACCGDPGGDRERDAAPWARLERTAHCFLGFLQLGVRRFGSGREHDAHAVDSIEQVKADVTMASEVERGLEPRARLCAPTAHEAQLGATLQRQRFARPAADRTV